MLRVVSQRDSGTHGVNMLHTTANVELYRSALAIRKSGQILDCRVKMCAVDEMPGMLPHLIDLPQVIGEDCRPIWRKFTQSTAFYRSVVFWSKSKTFQESIRIWCQVNCRSSFFSQSGLFKHLNIVASSTQCECCREPSDSGANDQDLEGLELSCSS